ncbi:MAG: cytochrome bc complex cytochrome b subunit [Chromatiales bacterium]|nr:cytochrome bc complex cytochrome b subunit [Chromatiales bacterium]
MSSTSGENTGGGLIGWIDARFPLTKLMKEHITEYYAPRNFNFWYVFGVLALVVLVIQLVTGIFLTMYYQPSAEEAFASVEFIMRDVEWGWLIRYMHSTGASFFFIVVYLHMFRGMMYGSYKPPRELLWIIGMLIYVVLMAEAFLGYVLPWGQMSYWGAQVIISLFGAVPGIGDALVEWIRGDYFISGATLNRFFALHVIAVPLALLLLVVLHIMALHEVGSLGPDGIEIKERKDASGKPLDGIAFHPYYTSKDLVAIIVFLIAFSAVVFFAPQFGGLFLKPANFEPANMLKTPDYIPPVWYFTPYYAMLRAVPSKGLGALLMLLAIVALFLLPWLDRCRVRSIRYRGWEFKVALGVFVVSFIALGWLGLQPATEAIYIYAARFFTALYFAFFIFMPLYTARERTRPVPERLT